MTELEGILCKRPFGGLIAHLMTSAVDEVVEAPSQCLINPRHSCGAAAAPQQNIRHIHCT